MTENIEQIMARVNPLLSGELRCNDGKLQWYCTDDSAADPTDYLWDRYCSDADIVRQEIMGCDVVDPWQDNDSAGFTVKLMDIHKDFDRLMTPEFLNTLRLAAKLHGWSGDHIEVAGFVQWAYEKAGRNITNDDLTPFEDEDELRINMTVVAAPIIESCMKCPFFKKGPDESTDGFDRGNDWICTCPKFNEERVIAGFVEWHEEKKTKIPEWCPVRK